MSLSINLMKIVDGGAASCSNRWSTVSFLNNQIITQGAKKAQYWPGFGTSMDLPCLDLTSRWDGVISYQGHLMLWQGSVIKWSDLNDFTNFIPVAATIQNIILTLTTTYTQLPPDITSAWIFVNESTAGMVPEMFVRIDYPPYYNFYTVQAVSGSTGVTGTSIGVIQVALAGQETIIYTTDQQGWSTSNGFIGVGDDGNALTVTDQSSATQLYATLSTGFSAPLVGQNVSAIFGSNPGWNPGEYISFGDQTTTGLDIYQVVSVDTITFTIVVKRMGIGTAQRAAFAIGAGVVTQPYVKISNTTAFSVGIPPNSVINERYGLQLSLENLTGSAPTGSTFIGGTQILSLNANEAGQLVNVGDRINGPVWAVTTLGLYAVIMKERSFQSVQYVGLPNIFFIWPEFADEGLLGRYTWTKVGENTIYFVGHRGFFTFTTGCGAPTEIGQKHFQQVLQEIDLGKVQEAFMFYKEDRHEVWFVYPVQGQNATPQRVLIYNFEQNTIAIDDYADSQAPITALGAIDYVTDLQWNNWKGEWKEQILSWGDLTDGKERLTLLANFPGGNPALFSHGRVFDRDGDSYRSEFDTVAHDCGDEQAWKYLDLLQFSLQVKEKLSPRPFRLFAQIGTQENYDGDIIWSTPQWIDCAGNANYVTKLNFKVSGRFITIKWYSDQADTQWRITSYSISGRTGGTY